MAIMVETPTKNYLTLELNKEDVYGSLADQDRFTPAKMQTDFGLFQNRFNSSWVTLALSQPASLVMHELGTEEIRHRIAHLNDQISLSSFNAMSMTISSWKNQLITI